MGRTNVTLAKAEPGVFAAEGFYFGMPGIAQIGVAVSRPETGDRSAVFRIEVPDINPRQFAGLPAVLGFGVEFPGIAGSPAAPTPASLARGRQLYARNCAACHGETGIGNGPASASLLPPPADLTLHARWHPDEQLHWFIAHGVPGTSMTAFGERIGAAGNWDIVNHLHELARAPTATALRQAPVQPAQIAAAKAEAPAVQPAQITAAKVEAPAPRPAYSVLSTARLRELRGDLPGWSDALDRYLEQITLEGGLGHGA